ncbi:MAG: fructokinase [Candidatus Azotimanducaceae bacterium]|jgi:fructokinase
MTNKTLSPRIGIDLGGTKIEIIVLDNDGETRLRQRVNTPLDNYTDILNTISQLVTDTTSKLGLADDVPIGICTPGAISLKTGLMMNCNSTCLNGMPLLQDLEAHCGRKVRIANDADCFTLSEASDGAAKNGKSVFGVILGTGVGGGIVINKQLNQGVNAISGEWGHIPLCLEALQFSEDSLEETPFNVSSRDCFCGRKNCIETWLAGPSLERTYFEKHNTHLGAKEISTLAGKGDELAIEALSQYCNLLALALSNIINILDPEVIVFGGGVSNIDWLFDNLPIHLKKYVFSDQVSTQLVKAKFGDSSGVRGAAWLWPMEPQT